MDLYERQRQLEEEMQGLGAKRFWKAVADARENSNETSTVYGQQLASHSVVPLADAITLFLEDTKKRTGPRPVAAKYLSSIDPKVAAFITVKVVLDCVTVRRTLQKTSIAIASGLEDEARFRHFAECNPALWDVLNRDLNAREPNRKRKRAILIHSMNKAAKKKQEMEWQEWGQVEKFHLGVKLVDLLVASTKLIKISTLNRGKRTSSTLVEATPETLEWIDQKTNRCELLMPVFLPTLIPPKPWRSPYSGGYHTKAVRPMCMVKTRNRNYLEELTHQVDEMPMVYQAINAIQETPWKINEAVLVVMQQVWDEGLDLASVPSRTDLPLPPKPHDIDTNKEARIEWSRKAGKVHEVNIKLQSKRLQMAKILYMAEKFKDEVAFYFPHQMDFRGRLYAVPSFLNPQGHDLAKALLCFGQGKAVGEAGMRWLKIHAANCFGEDKCSLDDRVKWADTHMARIVSVSKDPLTEQWWTEADKPWQFLAVCMEIHAVHENPNHVSHLPVSVDGSCNGLQNFSAMLRDPIGGAAVNLLPSQLPNDIYAQVAKVAHAKVTADAEAAVPYAAQWLSFGFDRKATKRPVMTLPYGATQYSARQYVMDYIVEKGNHPWGDDAFGAAIYLSRHIWTSIGEVVVAARRAMDWLQKTASIAASEGLPVNWRTPAGFPVLQSYPNFKNREVKTKLGDRTLIYILQEEDEKVIDRRRQASGISPNFVHSMDACALMMSVRRSVEAGITSFGMVHDSYGTLAEDMDVMAQCLREAFVELYQTDVLQEFRESILAGLSEKNQQEVPLCPPKGNLDLSAVRQSVYFFA
jgi:DNA-directed RNA polymerase